MLKNILLPLALTLAGITASADKLTWDMKQLSVPPKIYPAEKYAQPGVKTIFYDGPLYHGRKTRVFAYYGLPKNRNGKVPAMVLVHGGAGTAIPEWVRLWNERGYAAIAMDTCGSLNPDGKHKGVRHPDGGPGGWGSFNDLYYGNNADQDLWTWQATAQVILANSLLRSMPEIDAERIGLTGISWGGYLTCIAASADPRFKIAIPVYGCGFLYECPRYRDIIDKKAKIKERWLATCDPSLYLGKAKMPMLWLAGTNDFAFALPAWQGSYLLPRGPRSLRLYPRMPHGYSPGWAPEEIYAFADQHLKDAKPRLITVTGQGRDDMTAWVKFKASPTVAKAILHYTTDSNPVWKDRQWRQLDATLDFGDCRAIAELPAGTTAYFFNLHTAENLISSSEHQTLVGP
jgi:cephalosporin-C deacetylase-like acetyl esterase